MVQLFYPHHHFSFSHAILYVKKVIRPKLPMDLLQQGKMIGAMEDTIISLFASIQEHISNGRNVVVMLDNVEHIVGTFSSNTGTSEAPLVRRCRSIFMALLDFLQYRQPSGDPYDSTSNVLLLLTTSCHEIVSSMSFQFNRILYLEPPNEEERKKFLQKFIEGGSDSKNAQIVDNEMRLLNDLVDLTVGKSYAEIDQICRQCTVELSSVSIHGINKIDGKDFEKRSAHLLLSLMKDLLQSQTPESLRGGEHMDGYVQMRVFSARDLLTMNQLDNVPALLPSSSANSAWKALQSSIIIPLCRSKELHELLDTTKKGKPKTMTGAVLLTGESGSGKTAIALRCARYAAELLPTVKLIDVSCTSMIHKEVGASEQAIHHLFDAARRAAPVILLMDGIETIAAVRGNDATTEGTMDRILSTLLVELDGIDDNASHASQGGIAVIGITHDETWIDPALKRPGRLDRAIRMARDWI
jgi:SpoVK/Ycf46/Vps4 family AAA+-type ATPase